MSPHPPPSRSPAPNHEKPRESTYYGQAVLSAENVSLLLPLRKALSSFETQLILNPPICPSLTLKRQGDSIISVFMEPGNIHHSINVINVYDMETEN
jgi:hypothetical protein